MSANAAGLRRLLRQSGTEARWWSVTTEESMTRVELEQLRAVAREYRRQRDELGAALRELVRWGSGCISEPDCGDCRWCNAGRALASYERILSHEGRK